MSSIERKQELSLRTNAQHRQISELFEALHVAVETDCRMGPEAVGLLAQLVNVTEEHFRTEEEMMRLLPDWQQRLGWHIEQHRVLLFELMKLREDAPRRNAGGNLRLLDYLGRWMVEHMTTVDRDLDELGVSARELDRDILELGATAHEPVPWVKSER